MLEINFPSVAECNLLLGSLRQGEIFAKGAASDGTEYIYQKGFRPTSVDQIECYRFNDNRLVSINQASSVEKRRAKLSVEEAVVPLERKSYNFAGLSIEKPICLTIDNLAVGQLFSIPLNDPSLVVIKTVEGHSWCFDMGDQISWTPGTRVVQLKGVMSFG